MMSRAGLLVRPGIVADQQPLVRPQTLQIDMLWLSEKHCPLPVLQILHGVFRSRACSRGPSPDKCKLGEILRTRTCLLWQAFLLLEFKMLGQKKWTCCLSLSKEIPYRKSSSERQPHRFLGLFFFGQGLSVAILLLALWPQRRGSLLCFYQDIVCRNLILVCFSSKKGKRSGEMLLAW